MLSVSLLLGAVVALVRLVADGAAADVSRVDMLLDETAYPILVTGASTGSHPHLAHMHLAKSSVFLDHLAKNLAAAEVPVCNAAQCADGQCFTLNDRSGRYGPVLVSIRCREPSDAFAYLSIWKETYLDLVSAYRAAFLMQEYDARRMTLSYDGDELAYLGLQLSKKDPMTLRKSADDYENAGIWEEILADFEVSKLSKDLHVAWLERLIQALSTIRDAVSFQAYVENEYDGSFQAASARAMVESGLDSLFSPPEIVEPGHGATLVFVRNMSNVSLPLLLCGVLVLLLQRSDFFIARRRH